MRARQSQADTDFEEARTMSELERVIRQRRSTRMFLPHQPVPQELVYEALDLAVRAPSNSNIQP